MPVSIKDIQLVDMAFAVGIAVTFFIGFGKRIAETVANSKPFVEICDKNDRLSKIIL